MLHTHVLDFGREPMDEAIGPLQDRGGPSGLIIYKGYIVGQWGDPARVDMTNSVTKSFLSSLIGIAVDRGMISSVYDTVSASVQGVEIFEEGYTGSTTQIFPFTSVHNRQLNWDVMLRQTSDWEGTLWGKPDWADRPGEHLDSAWGRPRHAPGTFWKYNDVRVNALALAATCVWKKPLPQVLKSLIMDPIGAGSTWRWYGYRNSWIVLDGQPVQSVSGGGHWGGGMFINSYDMGRFGLLTLHRGVWNGNRILSDQWVTQALTPTAANPEYGYMNWFLNTGKKLLPDAPENAYVHIGNGANIIYVDPKHDLVVVARWLNNNSMNDFIRAVLSGFH